MPKLFLWSAASYAVYGASVTGALSFTDLMATTAVVYAMAGAAVVGHLSVVGHIWAGSNLVSTSGDAFDTALKTLTKTVADYQGKRQNEEFLKRVRELSLSR